MLTTYEQRKDYFRGIQARLELITDELENIDWHMQDAPLTREDYQNSERLRERISKAREELSDIYNELDDLPYEAPD